MSPKRSNTGCGWNEAVLHYPHMINTPYSRAQRFALFGLRISLGWIFFYAGITKVINPAWSAAGYLSNAKTFHDFFVMLTQPGILPIINFLNAWGLTLVGVALLLGIAVRFSSVIGALLMVLYYLPGLKFPYPNANSFLVDEHVVYAIGFFLLAAFRAGRVWGLETKCAELPFCKKNAFLRNLIG